MALTFLNPTVQDLTNYGIQGLRVYLQLFTAGTYATTFVDAGAIENLSKAREVTENKLDTSRNGIRTPLKALTASFAETVTFDTLNIGDPVLAGLFEGNEALTMVAPTGKIVIRKPGTARQCRFVILNPGAPNTDSTLLYIPKATIEGVEETQSNGTDAARLGFKVTLLTDETYKIPASVLASNDSAPYGARGILEASATPIADLEALVQALTPA